MDNVTDSTKRRKAERIFGALSGVDEELLVRSEKEADTGKVIPFWKYSKVAAACLCVAVLGVAYWAMSEVGIIGGESNDMTMAEDHAYSLREYDSADDVAKEQGIDSGMNGTQSPEAAADSVADKEELSAQKTSREEENPSEAHVEDATSQTQDSYNTVDQNTEGVQQSENNAILDKESVCDVPLYEAENVEKGLTLKDARETEMLGNYVPDAPAGYVLDDVSRTFNENNLGEKEYYELHLRWVNESQKLDEITINITWLGVKTAHLYRAGLVDINDEASYDVNLYDIPYGETVPQKYWQVFDHPVFAAGDMSLEIVQARMKSYNDSGDTKTPRGNFEILFENGILLDFRGDCDPKAVWDMLKNVI